MKILKTALVILAIGALLFFGSAYYFSSSALKKADEWSKKLLQLSPQLKVADYKYKRGLFSSIQDITYELPSFGNNTQAERIIFHNVIYHGPFPHFSSIGKARIEHTLSFSDDTTRMLNKFFNNKSPLEATTKIDLFGNGITELRGNPASYKDNDSRISWAGLNGTIRFTKDIKSYQGEISVPGVNFVSRYGNGYIKNLSLKFDQQKLTNTETLYAGDSSFHIATMSFTKKDDEELQINDFGFKVGAHTTDPQYLDIIGRLSIGNIRSRMFSVDNAEYAFSLKHLHVAELDNWNKDMQLVNEQLAGRNNGGTLSDKEVMESFISTFKKHGFAILKHDPIFNIDNMGFRHKTGEVKFNGSVKFINIVEDDMQNVPHLFNKINAVANISIPEALVNTLQSQFQPNIPKSQSENLGTGDAIQFAEETKNPSEQMLEQFTSMGYIKRENGQLTSKVEFKHGQVTVNGKSLNSMRTPPNK